MTSKEIIEKLDSLIYVIDNENSEIKDLIHGLSVSYKAFGNAFDHIFVIPERPIVAKNPMTDELASVKEVLDRKRVGLIFIQLDELTRNIYLFEQIFQSNRSNNPISQLITRLKQFFSEFELSINNYTNRNVFSLMKIAYDLDIRFESLRSFSKSFKLLLAQAPEIKEDNKELSIFFKSEIGFDDLIIKLKAVGELYAELCRLLNVSTSEYPLEIAKLEVGSWWLKIFGESKVITLMTSLIDSGISFIHRNYTKEGKIQSIPKNSETIEKLLDLSNKLKESGIDTKDLESNIKQSAVVLVNSLNKLLDSAPNVEINDKRHYIGEELDEKFLLESKNMFLEAGEPDELSNEGV